MQSCEFKYAGFWVRTVATITDTVLVLMYTLPLLIFSYGWEYFDMVECDDAPFILGWAELLISWVSPFVLTMLFWVYKQATPGKMAVSVKILDAKTGLPASTAKLTLRYFVMFIATLPLLLMSIATSPLLFATLPLLLGLFWIAFDKKKQGVHDKIAGTIVVKYY